MNKIAVFLMGVIFLVGVIHVGLYVGHGIIGIIKFSDKLGKFDARITTLEEKPTKLEIKFGEPLELPPGIFEMESLPPEFDFSPLPELETEPLPKRATDMF